MRTLKEMYEEYNALDKEMNEYFDKVWQPRFQKCMTDKEFGDVRNAMGREANDSIDGTLFVRVMLEMDGLRCRQGKYDK